MPSAISRPPRNRASKRKNGVNQPQPATPIYITTAVPAASVLTLTFDQPVSLSGTPAIRVAGNAANPLSAVQTAANVVAITFSATVAAATVLEIPYRDPAIRNASGGYVTGNSFNF